MRAALVCALLLAGCKDKSPYTPEQVAAGVAVESKVMLQGTVHGVTFDSDTANGYPIKPVRWVLVRTVRPNGVSQSVPGGLVDDPAIGFGFGLQIPLDASGVPQRPLPAVGDAVRASGTFRKLDWNGHSVPALADLTELTVMQGAAPLLEEGKPCRVDMDCREHLLCDRASRTCLKPPAGYDWGAKFRNLNGACDADEDCPPGQVCDARYTIPGSGDYAPINRAGDKGRKLCIPEPTATMDTLCPRIGTASDLAGGRYAEAKEVCVKGTLLVAGQVEGDNDTHTQLYLDEPLPFPKSDIAYAFIGATTENVPPYKDPSRAAGAILDPPRNKPYVVMGTVRYDDGHGWWEIHPIKAWWLAP